MSDSMKKYIFNGKLDGIVKEIPVVEEAFRKYSECMEAWLSTFTVPRSDKNIKVEVVYSSPNIATALRAATTHAEDPEVNRELSQKLVDLREDRTKIPIIAFNISSANFLMDFQLPQEIFYFDQFVDDSKREALMRRKDLPYQLQYSCNIWTKTKVDMNYILQQILSQFGPDIVFRIDGQNVTMLLESITDASVLETGNTGAYQLVRNVVVFTMKQVWIKTNPIIVKTVIYQKQAYGETMIDPLNLNAYLITTTKPTPDYSGIVTVVDKTQ